MTIAALLVGITLEGRHSFDVTGAHLIVAVISAFATILTVLFHYEAMSLLSRILLQLKMPRRSRIVLVILGMLLATVVEVWFFGLLYLILDHYPGLSRLHGTLDEGMLDFVYFSVVTYSSLGFGDIVPTGPLRILAGTEGLLGLALITWTASFAFLEMQRDWGEFRRAAPRHRGDEE